MKKVLSLGLLAFAMMTGATTAEARSEATIQQEHQKAKKEVYVYEDKETEKALKESKEFKKEVKHEEDKTLKK